MRLPLFVLAGTLACFISEFIPQGNSSYLNSNSISFLSKIPFALVFISKEINARRDIWVPKNVPVIMPMEEGGDGSVKDEYTEVANVFAKPGSKVVQEEEVVSDQPYPYISLAEEWKLAHLQSPYVLKRKQGSSKKTSSSSDEAAGEVESDDDGDDPTGSSSDEQDEEESPVASSTQVEDEEDEEDEELIPQGDLEGPPEDSSEISPLPPPQNEESDEQFEVNSEEGSEESEERSSSKVPLQALSHVDQVDEDDSTETNLELIPDEVKDKIVREMAKQFAQQARISASKIKKEIKTTKPNRDHYEYKENDREIVRVTDSRISSTNSDGPYNDSDGPYDDVPSSSEKKKPVRDRVTNSDGPFYEGKGKKKSKGKRKNHWKPPPKIWHPPPPPEHHHHEHKPHIRDGLLEQWTKGSQWERILHSYHGWKDKQEYDLKHGHIKDDGEGPIHKHKPGIAQKLLKGSFWERAFITYANYKQKQQNKGAHEMVGEGWAPFDR